MSARPRVAGIVRRWWDTCAFTRVLRVRGSEGNATAALSLHSTGRYLLRKRWRRAKNEPGTVTLREVGSFARRRDNIEMTSDDGWHRRLVPDGERAFRVLEDGVTGDHVIEDWRLEP